MDILRISVTSSKFTASLSYPAHASRHIIISHFCMILAIELMNIYRNTALICNAASTE